MAPAGSYEALQAAVQAGADAVYFGVGQLNMRSKSAANFTPDDLERIVGVARAAGGHLALDGLAHDLFRRVDDLLHREAHAVAQIEDVVFPAVH